MIYEVCETRVLYTSNTRKGAEAYLNASKDSGITRYIIVEREITTIEFCKLHNLSVDDVVSALDKNLYVGKFLTDLGLSHDEAPNLPVAIKKFYNLKEEGV